jgi:hypothetical protein
MALAGVGWAACGFWLLTGWRCRHGLPPVEVWHAAIVTLVLVIGAGTAAAVLDLVADRGTGDVLRAITRSSALMGGIYALMGTRT